LDTTENEFLAHWGSYRVIHQDENSWTRALTIKAGEGLSLHYHEHRRELWYPLTYGLTGIINGDGALDLLPGTVYDVPQNVLHRIINKTALDARLIEVSAGTIDESDEIIIYDKYRS